jgi:hypothetical protein
MRILFSTEVGEFIRERGGRVFVWPEVRRCCSGGISYLATSTEAAPERSDFQKLPVDGFEVWFAAGVRQPPDELHLDLKGWRRRRVEAYWEGCVFVV